MRKLYCSPTDQLSRVNPFYGASSADEEIAERAAEQPVVKRCRKCINDCKQHQVLHMTSFICFARREKK